MRRIQCQSFTRAYPIQMGLQVPRSFRTQTAPEGHFWSGAPATGCDLPRAGPAKECQIIEGHLMPDHVHMLIAIPPNTVWRQSWAFSKVKVRSGSLRMWPTSRETLSVTSSGPEAILSPRLVLMSKSSERTLRIKRKRISVCKTCLTGSK